MGINLTFQNVDDNGRKIKGKHLKLFLCSIYHPVDNKEYEEFNNLIPSLTARCPRDAEMIFCHDVNCNVGVSSTREDTFRETVGPHGLDNRNKKGHELLQLLASHDMKITNSYFRKESHTTWKSFNSLETQHMLDVISTSSTLFKRVLNCGVSKFGIDKSDHSAVEMKLHLNSIPIKVKAPTLDAGTPDWRAIMEKEDTNATYNEKTRELSPSNDPNYTSFFQAVAIAAKSTATKIERRKVDWFEMSKEKVQPVINEMYRLLNEFRNSEGEVARILKEKLKLASKMRTITVDIAKSTYLSFKAREVGTLAGRNNKEMWMAVRECELGNEINHVKPKKMALRMANGEKTKNDEENMSIMHPHCEKSSTTTR